MSINKLDEFRELTIHLRDQYRLVNESVESVDFQEVSVVSTEDLERINELFVGIKKIESQLKPIRESLEAAGEHVPQDLKPTIDETIRIVMNLIPRIAALEQAAMTSRNELAPHIHASVRAIQMQNAYSRGR